MKAPRLTTVCLTLLTAASPIAAQQVEPPMRQIGAIAGGNLSTFGGPDGDPWERRTGFMAGAFLKVPVSETALSYRFELLFSQKGAALSIDGESGGYRVSYLQLHTLGQYDFRIQESSGLMAEVHVGTTLGVMLGCDIEATSGGVSAATTCDLALGDEPFSPVDMGALGGLLVRSGNLGVGLRYEFGLLDVSKLFTAEDVRNRTLSLTLQYAVRI